jgi:hypothetical protein
MDRVTPQVVMLIEVFIARHQTIGALTKELMNAMFNIAGPGSRQNSRLSPLMDHCGVQAGVISAYHHRWRGINLKIPTRTIGRSKLRGQRLSRSTGGSLCTKPEAGRLSGVSWAHKPGKALVHTSTRFCCGQDNRAHSWLNSNKGSKTLTGFFTTF